MQLALAVIFIVLLAAGTGIGIYFIVKSLRAKKGAPPKQPRTPPPPTQPRTPPTQPRIPPTQPLLRIPPPPAVPPPKPKPLEFAPYIPAKPKAQPPATKPPPPPPTPPPSKPPPQTPRTNCPKGKVPDPDNPSKLCKPSCRGVNLGYPYWGASGSCCASIANADCISWAQISKIDDDKLAAEAERKRLIAEAEAEKKRLAAIEAERKRLADIEAEKKRLAAIEVEKKRQQEAERQRIEAERQKYSTGVAEMQRMLDGWRADPEIGGAYNNIYNKADNLTYFVSTKISDQQGAVRKLSALQADAVKVQRYLADSPNDKAAGQRLVPFAPTSGASRIVGGTWTSGTAGWTMGEGTGVMCIMKLNPPADAWPNEKRYYFFHELSHAAAPCAACPHNITFYNQWRVVQKAAQIVLTDYKTSYASGTDALEPPDDPARYAEWNPVNDKWWPRIQYLVNKYSSQKLPNFYP